MSVITEDQALDAVRRVLGSKNKAGGDELALDTPLDDLELDSLDVSEVFLELEKASDAELDPASAEGLATVGDLTKLRPL